MINTGFLPPLQQSSTRKCKTHHAIYFSQPVNQIVGIQVTEEIGFALKESFLMESSWTLSLGKLEKIKGGGGNVIAVLLRCCSVGADPGHYVPNKTVITFQSRRLRTIRRCLKPLNHWAPESPLLSIYWGATMHSVPQGCHLFDDELLQQYFHCPHGGEKHWMCPPEREAGPVPLYDRSYISPTLGCNLFITWNRLSVPFISSTFRSHFRAT